MQHYSHCPTCGSSIDHSKTCGQTLICGCGWTHSYASAKNDKLQSRRVFATMSLMFLLFLGSFIHAVNWDSYFFSIIPLKLKQHTNTAKSEDLRQIVDICSQRAKSGCMEKAFKQIYALNPQDIEVLTELGRHQFKADRIQDAAQTLEVYFSQGGKSLEAAQDYARALSTLGQFKESIRYFQLALKGQSKNFQAALARDYVHALIKHKRLPQAKSTIEHYRKQSVSSAYFMEKEYREILSQLRLARTIAKSH